MNDAAAVVVLHSRPPKPPRPTTHAGAAAAVRSSPAVHRSALTADENLEIASYLQRQPATVTPRRTSVPRRAVSVPPPGPRPTVPRWFPSSGGGGGGGGWGGARRSYVAAPRTGVHLPPSETVVGVAHTSLYGDIVIGIPAKKRFMFNAQVGLRPRGH